MKGVRPMGCPWHHFDCGRGNQCLTEVPLRVHKYWQQCLLVPCHYWLARELFLIFESAKWAQKCLSTNLSTSSWILIRTTFSKCWYNTIAIGPDCGKFFLSKIWTILASLEIMLISAFLNISQETQKSYISIVNALFLHYRFLLEDTQLDQTFSALTNGSAFPIL